MTIGLSDEHRGLRDSVRSLATGHVELPAFWHRLGERLLGLPRDPEPTAPRA